MTVTPKLHVRLLLFLILAPFLVAGILLAHSAAMWITGSTNSHGSPWYILAFMSLMPFGILLGSLVAYGIIIFFLTLVSPTHPLLTESEESLGVIARFIHPAFRMVRSPALRLAGTRRQ
jgi:hypothetical protein